MDVTRPVQRDRHGNRDSCAYWVGEPSCWAWPVPPAVLAEVTALQRYADAWVPGSKNHQHPVCYGGSLLYRWQAERCAICGVTRRLIRDHDHGSGLLRGWLCLSCNAADGKLLSRPLFARYACRHPASMLGVRVTWRG